MTQQISLKRWLSEEGERQGVTPNAIWMRMKRGKYPWLRKVFRNARVVDVRLSPEDAQG